MAAAGSGGAKARPEHKGALRDGGVADALERIAATGATGALHIAAQDLRAEIHCIEGRIVMARPKGADADERLAEHLVRSGALDEATVERSLADARRAGLRLPAVLGDRIARDELTRILQVQVADVVLDAFMAPRGRWELHVAGVEVGPYALDPADPRALIADGQRALAEWPVVRTVIDSPRLRFRKLKGPDARPDGAGLSPNDHFVLTLIREDRDVRDIEFLARLGRFEAHRALYQLVAEGYIGPKGLSPAEEGPVSPADRWSARRRRWTHAAAHGVLVALACAGALLWAREALRPRTGPVTGSAAEADRGLRAQLGRNQAARIRVALDVYRLRTGAQPETLEAVVQAGLLLPDDVTYPRFEAPFHFEREGEQGYRLLLPVR